MHSGSTHFFLELKLQTFFKKYKKNLIQSFLGLSALVLIFLSIDFYRNYRKALCKDAYLQATSYEKKLIFIEDFKMEPLAGLVALELADDEFEKKNMQKAKELYNLAQAALVPIEPLYQRVLYTLEFIENQD